MLSNQHNKQYLCYSVILTGFVYPIVAHSVWSRYGFLSHENAKPLFGVGVLDFAGGGVVHLTGGLTALFATMVRPRSDGKQRAECGGCGDNARMEGWSWSGGLSETFTGVSDQENVSPFVITVPPSILPSWPWLSS
jgi:hypothetical protein